jgi:hypothetical protein
MTAAFSGVFLNSGVDSGDGGFQAGMIVPFGGINLLVLNNGMDLRIDHSKGIEVKEVTSLTTQMVASIAKALSLDVSAFKIRLDGGGQRFFLVKGSAFIGKNKGEIRARRGRAAVAKIKVGVLPAKSFSVAIRQVQMYRTAAKDPKDVVLSSQDAFDPAKILANMNSVWTPQTNISFTLAKTNPLLMPALPFDSEGPDAKNTAMTAAFEVMALDDSKAHLTIFTVHKTFDGGFRNPVAGYTHAKSKFSVVADHPLEFTFEHETGHFLGALDAKGKFIGFTDLNGNWAEDYPHRAGTLMTVTEASNGRIPYDLAFDFNKGI